MNKAKKMTNQHSFMKSITLESPLLIHNFSEELLFTSDAESPPTDVTYRPQTGYCISINNLPYEKIGNNEPVCIADELPFAE